MSSRPSLQAIVERARRGDAAGVQALFVGPRGSGKSRAAEQIARELGRELLRVDLRHVVSKYISETEKNLARIFEQAEQSGAVLLFDEADALFGRHTEVKDSHDRYADRDVSSLLQRLGRHRGPVILATSAPERIDPALLGRLPAALSFDPPRRRLLGTELEVHPLCLGGNVFGWSADEKASFEVLDEYARAGGNFVDTADAYSSWAPGNAGGESETILGRWMKERGGRDSMVVATKVGKLPGATGLSAKTIAAAADASLRRLQTDRIDLYYAHVDDEKTPLMETLAAFDQLVKAGKVRCLGASNHTAPRLAEALAVSKKEGLARYVAAQDHYHLLHRADYEGPLADLCVREQLSFLPYYALAQGFLSGKYRPGAAVESVRANGAGRYLDARGGRMLAALDEIAARRRTTVAAVALAWLLSRPNVVAPIASARTPAQLFELLPMATLELARDELARLDAIR